MNHIANARAGGDGREEGFDILFAGYDGLAEIERDERRERGGLAGVGSGLDLLGEARGGELPEGGSSVGLRNGEDAEVLPEFGEGAEDGGLGDLFAELGCQIVGGEGDALGQKIVGGKGEGRDLGGPAGGRRLLPGFVAAEGEDVGEGEGGDDEVWDFGAGAGGVAEQVERDGAAVGDEAGEQAAGLIGFGQRGGGIGSAQDGLDEGRRGRWESAVRAACRGPGRRRSPSRGAC